MTAAPNLPDMDSFNPDGGFTISWRRKWDNPIFRNKQEAAVWVWMCDKAQWEPVRYRSKFGPISLERGELVIAERELAEDFGMHRNTLRSLIQRIADDGMITLIRDRIPHRAGTIVRIEKYEEYQSFANVRRCLEDRKTRSVRTEAGPNEDRSRTESKEVNKLKEGKKESPQPPEGGGEPDLFSPSETKGDEHSAKADQPKKTRRTKEPPRFKPKEVAAIVADFAAAYPKGDVPFVFEGPVTNSIDRIVNRECVDPMALIAATRRYADKMRAKGNIGTEFVKMPNNWLRNGDWKAFDGVHFLPNGQPDNQEPTEEPCWKSPHGWSDQYNPPPWPDAPNGTQIGRWLKASNGWNFKGQRDRAK